MMRLFLLTVSLMALLGCAANPLLTGGKIQLQLNDLERAVELLTQNVQENPNDPEGYLWLGIAQGRNREYCRAAEAFNRAVGLDSLYLDKMKRAEPDEYWGGGPSYWVTYINCGIALMNEKEFTQAEGRFLRALEIQPDSSSSHNYLGFVYSKLGKNEEACKAYQAAVDLGPKNVDAILNLAACRLKEQDYEGALKLLDSAVRIDSTSDRAYYHKGICHFQREENEQAETAFRRATELNPKNKDALYNLGIVYLQGGNASEAAKSLEKAIELAPDDEDAHFQLGSAYYKLEEYQKAADTFTRVVELNPNNADAYENRGYCRSKLGLKKEAYDDQVMAEKLRQGGG